MKFAAANSTSSASVSVKPLFALKKKLPSWLQAQQPKYQLGLAGEQLAQTFLRVKGYRILGTNLGNAGGELDIVAFKPTHQQVVFVEVKTRTQAQHTEVAKLVTARQVRAWRQTAMTFLQKHRLAKSFQFDIIYVSNKSIQHFENITME